MTIGKHFTFPIHIALLSLVFALLSTFLPAPLHATEDLIQKLDAIFNERIEAEILRRQAHKEYLRLYDSPHPSDNDKVNDLCNQMAVLKERIERLEHEFSWILIKIPQPKRTELIKAYNVKERELLSQASKPSSGSSHHHR